MTTPASMHPFERAGLGKAPFRCTGHYEAKYQACPGAPIQPGSSCDYCGTGIMDVFMIRSADERTFNVGCDCVAKTYRESARTEFEREARRLHDEVNREKTKHRNASKDVKIDEARARFDACRGQLAGRKVWVRDTDRDAVSYLEWMFAHAGRAGKLRAAKMLDQLLGEVVS